MHAEVAVVHFVEHGVGDIVNGGTTVVVPAFGVGCVEVDYCGSMAVGPYGLCPNAGSFGKLLAVDSDGEGVEFAIKFLGYRCAPCTAVRLCHGEGVDSGRIAVGIINQNFCLLCLRRPKGEVCAGIIDTQFEVVATVGRPAVVLLVVERLSLERCSGKADTGRRKDVSYCHMQGFDLGE